MGDYSFGWSNTMKFESMNIESRYIDLPELSSIRLGSYSLFGKWGYKWCSLSMKSMINMNERMNLT